MATPTESNLATRNTLPRRLVLQRTQPAAAHVFRLFGSRISRPRCRRTERAAPSRSPDTTLVYLKNGKMPCMQATSSIRGRGGLPASPG